MSSKALFIVEGAAREEEFFSQIQDAFRLDIEIVPFCGNVSMLYDEMAKTSFMSDVKTLLLARTEDPAQRRVLQDVYSDVFMIFDLDPQHGVKTLSEEDEDGALRRNANAVFAKALAMAKRLNNSTDPTLGQLYVNYPGIESFRDADALFDPKYADKFVPLKSLCKKFGGEGYKRISARGKLSRKRLSSYSETDFSTLAAMNVFKLKRIVDGVWHAMPYDEFREKSGQDLILERQRQHTLADLTLGVINTSLFFLFDYKGRPYYERFVLSEATAQPGVNLV